MQDRPTFPQVRNSIARFSRDVFVEEVARLSSELRHGKVPEARRADGSTTVIGHHFLARVALIAIIYGRQHGTSPSRDDVIDACIAWNSMDEPFWHVEDPGRSDLDAFFIRTGWDQFPVQERPGDNLTIWFGIYRRARAAGIFGDTFDNLWNATFKCPRTEWYSAALAVWLMWSATTLSQGTDGLSGEARQLAIGPVITRGELRAHLSSLDGELGPVLDDIERAIDDLSQSRDDLAQSYSATCPSDELLERYAFNPLTMKPVLRLGPRYVAPVPRLFGNACGLATLYRLTAAMPEFPRLFGSAFESYVGEVLRASFGDVRSEPKYRVRGQEWGGFDWVVLDPEFTLLVECRTSRLSAPAKTSGDLDAIVEGLKRIIAAPASKFEAKVGHIRDSLTPIPAECLQRPSHRLIVTLEDLHLDSLYSELLGSSPGDPATPIVVSVAGLQRLLGVPQANIHELIDEFQATYHLATSGSIDQWLRSRPERATSIQDHPTFAEDRALLHSRWRPTERR